MEVLKGAGTDSVHSGVEEPKADPKIGTNTPAAAPPTHPLLVMLFHKIAAGEWD